MNQFAWAPPVQAQDARILETAFIIDMALIAALWCVSSFVVNPVGDFPLNDDWAYGRMVQHLLETGDYRPLKWALAPSVTNILWGSLFCLPAGFSFTALRLSSMVVAWLGVVGSYVLIRDLQQPRWFALLVALTFGFNGIYYALANTFMTDAPFAAVAIWATVFLARSLKSGSHLEMAFGVAFAVAATLSRQLALCIPLAFAVTVVLRQGITLRTALRGSIPLVLCAGGFFAFRYWLAASGRLPTLYDDKTNDLLRELTDIKSLLTLAFDNFFVYMLYLGLFLFPVLLVSVRDLFLARDNRRIAALVAGVLTVAAGAVLRLNHGDPILLPFMYNILAKSGIGPLTLRDTFVLQLEHLPALAPGFWIAVTAIALVGAVLLVAKLVFHGLDLIQKLLGRRDIEDIEAVGVFLVICVIVYLLPLLATRISFDRYLIPLVPLLAASIAAIGGRVAEFPQRITQTLRVSAFALLAAFGLFAIGATRDYLAWNRVRWTALEDLMHSGVDARDIDGGFEFNGLYLYNPNTPIDFFKTQKSWWWVQGDTYQIGFDTVSSYAVIREYSYQHWLPWHVQKILVLHKSE